MKIDYEKLKAAFPGKAWAYAEGHDAIKITKWTGDGFVHPVDEEYLTLLRVFDSGRELLFSGGKCRDTAAESYSNSDFIPELADVAYFMYGEQAKPADGVTLLSEARGGVLLFPAELNFPQNASLPNGAIGLKLGIKNFVRYNPVHVLPKDEEYDFELFEPPEQPGRSRRCGGAIEVVDYAYTGFFYPGTNGEADQEVKL